MPPRVEHLTVFLLKPNAGLPTTALKAPRRLTRYGIRPTMPFRGSLWVRPQRSDLAAWLRFVRPGLFRDLQILTATSSAVLLLETGGRYFAITFGYGRALLDRNAFERDFGLKVTLNAVKPESIRSIDAQTFETPLTLRTRRQASRGSGLDFFGLNVSADLVRGVAGDPRDAAFARRLAGSDAVALSAALDFQQLGDKCAELLEMYGRDTYRDQFAFIDRLRRVSDPDRIARLGSELEQLLRRRELDRVHLALPEIEDEERIRGFSYSTNPDQVFQDLDLEQFLNTYPRQNRIDVRSLKRTHVQVHYVEGAAAERWTVFECLTAEINLEGKLFALSTADWFEVDAVFADEIGRRVAALAATPLTLPQIRRGEKERAYNARAARALGHAPLDERLVRCQGTRTPIEICDLFTAQRQLVHVKRKTRSATLSHLFAQGLVSAESLLFDPVFRQAARDELAEVAPAMVEMVSVGRPQADSFEVGYVVLSARLAGWPGNLPFFSQVNLCNAADRLERLGFRVSLTGIGEA